MTDLNAQLSADFKEAMRSKDTVRKDVVQLVRAGVLQIKKDEQIEADNSTVIRVVQREVKKRRELIDEVGADRQDLAEQAKQEIAILESYLPEQLSEDEIRTVVQDLIVETGASSMRDMGKLMPKVLEKIEGQADGKTISAIVKELLS